MNYLPWLAAALLLGGPLILPEAQVYLLVFGLAFFYAALAMAWNILALSGLFSLGHGAFFGLGAYAAVLLQQKLLVPVYPAVLAGGLAGALYGLLWGLIFKKLRGAYFALATLASLEVPRVIVDNWESLTAGSMGIVGIGQLPALDLGLLSLPVGAGLRSQYYFLFGWMALVTLLHHQALRRRWGWALRAIRDNEVAAEVLGVNVYGCRLAALGLSAFFTGVCGGLYAHLMGLIEPAMVFSLQLAAFPLILSFFGGRFAVFGPLLGALVLYPLDQLLLQPLWPQGHAAVYGLVIILTIFLFPRGLATWWRPRSRPF
ncbi:MAG: branched-chain amino acid ABC transporter permease [Desulfobacca sp.]|uniref:branched-chain amino acid ABC transporter permease n=1 Tax=Desulfobacca sp. TaxID=2067990 RepID=UPI00404962FF